MICRHAFAVALLAALLPPTRAAADTSSVQTRYMAPTPRMLDLLERAHRPRDWLLVTTRGERLRLRADEIDARGLSGLHGHGRPVPDPVLEWKDIAGIERRASASGAGRVVGAVLGAIAVGSLGGMADNSYGSGGDPGALAGIGLGVLAGGWLGGELGDRSYRTIPLYAARPVLDGPAGSADTIAAAFAAPAPAGWPAPSVDLARVRASVRPRDVVLVRGEFGLFAGRVEVIDSTGLHGLRPDRRFDSGLSPLPDPIPWSSIASIDRRGNSARRGALVGALLVGIPAGSLAAAVVASGLGLSSGGSDEDVLGAFALGAAVGGLAGGSVGALLGSTIGTWHRVPGVSRPTAVDEGSVPRRP